MGLPDGAMYKNQSASVGDTGSVLGLGRFHMLRAAKPMCPRSRSCKPQLLSLCYSC